MAEGMMMDMTEDTSNRRLIRAAPRSCPRDDDESVEDHPERSHTEDNACNSHLNLPEVERQGATKQQERNLQHHWKGLHHVVKVPGDDPIQLPLAILAALYPSPSYVGRCVPV